MIFRHLASLATGDCTPSVPLVTGNSSNATAGRLLAETVAAPGFSTQIMTGVIIAIFASTSSNLGVNVQKYSFMQEEKRMHKEMKKMKWKPGMDRPEAVPYTMQWRWWIGMCMVVLGAIGDFACYGLAPQTIVTPMGSLSLVTNVGFAHFWLGEETNELDVVGTVLILVGATVAVAFGDHDEQCYTMEELMRLYTNPWVIGELILVVMLLVSLYFFSRYCEKLLLDHPSGHGHESEEYQRVAKWHPLCYSALGGIWGGQTCLFAKSTAELLKETFKGNNQLIYPLTWVIVLMMVFTIMMETHWLATGLKFFDALYIVPTFQVFFVMSSVIGGAIFFQELDNFTWYQWIFFPGGVATCIFGVFLLSQRNMGGEDFDFDIESQKDGDLVDSSSQSSENLLAAENVDETNMTLDVSPTSARSARNASDASSTTSAQSLPTLPGSPMDGNTHKRRRSLTEPTLKKAASSRRKRRSIFAPKVRDGVIQRSKTFDSTTGDGSFLGFALPGTNVGRDNNLDNDVEGGSKSTRRASVQLPRNLVDDAWTARLGGITDLGLKSDYANNALALVEMERIPSQASSLSELSNAASSDRLGALAGAPREEGQVDQVANEEEEKQGANEEGKPNVVEDNEEEEKQGANEEEKPNVVGDNVETEEKIAQEGVKEEVSVATLDFDDIKVELGDGDAEGNHADAEMMGETENVAAGNQEAAAGEPGVAKENENEMETKAVEGEGGIEGEGEGGGEGGAEQSTA